MSELISELMNANKAARLSDHARAVIDNWLAKYPPDRQRSAVLAALREVQHENGGYLTQELLDAVGSAGEEGGLPDEELAYIDRMEGIHVLVRVNQLDHPRLPEL